ncbi:Endoribonuclease L-PSP superfamily [Synechococcus sp. PCC 7335]|uniref:RidA family protein n=1 Tax=Synechococcus sp. (strain ATCC 29403 / PCC 7335) TaxID=91464 RepID=UPI00017EE7E4|nr:RidA family protein [Synechococcus sp. PCC 7335]EDX85780.1 Endoribonuclease L-PSP superfamily [Synechococcus sp. PCC 7335]
MTQEIQRINPSDLGDPSSYGFTNVVVVPTGKTLIFLSGQGGRDQQGRMGSFETQLKQAFENLRTGLAAAGAVPEDVVKITVLSVDHNADKQKLISAERNALWPDKLVKPASTLIPVPRLAGDDMLFEIDAITAISPA